MSLTRRAMLAGTVLSAAAPTLARAAGEQKILRLQTRQIEVGGKAASAYGALQPSGVAGLTLNEGDEFDVRLENTLAVPSGLHWHGMIPPWRQDGVPFISGPPVMPGQSAEYKFPARPTGTRWMHSHVGLQEQSLLAAPLIVREAEAIRSGAQEVVILLQDFSWTDPKELLEGLRKPKAGGMNMSGMNMSGGSMSMSHGSMNMSGSGGSMNMSGSGGSMNMSGSSMGGQMAMHAMDLNDITFDAFLANDRTLADPQVVAVERNAVVRLRIINAAASTNFTIDLGALTGTLVAVDGNPIVPLPVRQVPLGIAQRADIMVRVAAAAVPVLARCEGRTLQTGVILQPPGASVARLANDNAEAGPVVGPAQEMQLRARDPLPNRPVDRSVPVELIGNMATYSWGMAINHMGGAPATVKRGERVELVMHNTTTMAHPMHLHGHNFQVTEIGGMAIAGAVRDSVLVPPMATVKVVFDADNPGLWAYHCHNLYHMEAGMFATVVYEGFS
jgi:FtsP/CotA-like multicopper oxidase with cupredoxin domain